MKRTDNTIIFWGLIVVLLVAILGYRSIVRYTEMREKQLLYGAIDSCNSASKYISEVTKPSFVRTEAPMKDVFEKCMKDKGIKW